MSEPQPRTTPPPPPSDELDVGRIREQVAARAAAPPGAERVREAQPMPSRVAAESELEAVTQMGDYLIERSDAVFPCWFGHDLVQRLRIEGALLDRTDFLDVRRTLEAIAVARKRAQASLQKPAPRITTTVGHLPVLEELHRDLDRVFTPAGDLQDRASQALYDLRRARRGLIGSIEGALRHLLRDPNHEKWLAEEYFTQVNGRYVVLVRTDARGHVPGVVQGQSKSGLSLYVEPMSMVERNNELIRSYLEEEAEIARILARLSSVARAHRDELAAALDLLSWLDSLAARARWAVEHSARAPQFSTDGTFDLRGARHPLLGQRCVPIELRTGPGDRVLVLGGANSGGKTVALKTTGLLHLLAKSGFPIPCDDGTRVAFFERVFCEIGDKQSIDANLSSFSSHVADVAVILRSARRGDLVLLDEFMTGTDPQEGSALAETVLLELAERGTVTVITTHYNSIKLLKDRHPGFKNYAVEFDRKTLRPTYRLLENEYGASAGIEIAGRFGLPQVLTDRARHLLAKGEGNIASILSKLELERTRARQEHERHRSLVEETERLQAAYQKQLEELTEERRVRLGKRIREERLELVALRDFVREAVRAGQAADAVQAIEERATTVERQEEELAPPPSSEPIYPGDRVLVLDLNAEGEVLDLGPRQATVKLASGMPVKTKPAALRKLGPAKSTRPGRGRVTLEVSQTSGTGGATVEAGEGPGLELNLIQMRAEDAKEKLAWYLDRAYARGYGEVRIVHGKGDGVLRKVVEEYLRASPYPLEWRLGGMGEGDTGVTIVRLSPAALASR
ncbi:MAG: Smr/MutS family protein [Candidatus Riflebacteria bacterium]|nr:Smr/MutS family protein [Candidatus Riflebacteria bacterium]